MGEEVNLETFSSTSQGPYVNNMYLFQTISNKSLSARNNLHNNIRQEKAYKGTTKGREHALVPCSYTYGLLATFSLFPHFT